MFHRRVSLLVANSRNLLHVYIGPFSAYFLPVSALLIRPLLAVVCTIMYSDFILPLISEFMASVKRSSHQKLPPPFPKERILEHYSLALHPKAGCAYILAAIVHVLILAAI